MPKKSSKKKVKQPKKPERRFPPSKRGTGDFVHPDPTAR
jgi:hypothetical protein